MPEQRNEDAVVQTTPVAVPRRRSHKYLKPLLLILGIVLALLALSIGYIYTATPSVIRNPKLEHYHFRMQILVNGKAQDFSSKAYQTAYAKDQCNATLPGEPIHFHDGKDQFVHIHWEAMTGGLVMKYYGWNYIGGIPGALGYRFDSAARLTKVPIHGDILPTVPGDTTFYVYTGDEHGYKARSFNDWKTQDLEKFFGVTSNFPAHKINQQSSSLLNSLTPKAYAHSDMEMAQAATPTENTQERLTRINNILGNVVIFAQKSKPTDAQIKQRFNMLLPLDDSTCGG